MRQPWVIAHRGASGHAPENTVAAFRRAVELGARFIETDLHLSRDAHFVAIHDATLERTTNGKGLVRSLALAELRQLDAGSWFDPKFAGERLPTLEEILVFAREADVVFYLEVKPEATWGLHHALVSALRAAQGQARAVVLSFDALTLQNMRRLDSMLLTGLLFDGGLPDPVALAQSVGARQVCPQRRHLTRDLVLEAHRADLQVAAWTLDEPGEMIVAISADVDGIMTNFPDRLLKVLAEILGRKG